MNIANLLQSRCTEIHLNYLHLESSQKFHRFESTFSQNSDLVAAGKQFNCKLTWALWNMEYNKNATRWVDPPVAQRCVADAHIGEDWLWWCATCFCNSLSRFMKLDRNYLWTFANLSESGCSHSESGCLPPCNLCNHLAIKVVIKRSMVHTQHVVASTECDSVWLSHKVISCCILKRNILTILFSTFAQLNVLSNISLEYNY